jgi:hypothetical protein
MNNLSLVREVQAYFRTNFTWSQKKSIYFITFHRSGSSFCEKYLLPSVKGLRHIDYASLFYHGLNPQVTFKSKGFLYGPLRLSTNSESPVYKKVVAPLFFDNEKIFQGKSIFFIRDPREVIVSSYDAFGYTHGISLSDEISGFQLKRRQEIQSLSLDEYVLKYTDQYKRLFEKLIQIQKNCPDSILLKFEEMIFDWEDFLFKLSNFVELDQKGINRLQKNKKSGDNTNGSESSRITANRHRFLLKEKTIADIDNRLGSVLSELGYA